MRKLLEPRPLLYGLAFFFVVVVPILIFGCGRAQSSDVEAIEIKSPVGVQCYTAIQNGNAIGVSCLPLR